VIPGGLAGPPTRDVSALGPSVGLRFASVLDGISRLPTLPEVIVQILPLVDDPAVSADDLAEKIGQDLSLTSSIMRLVNSPFCGLSRRVATIRDAVILLGSRTVRNLAFSTALVRTFATGPRELAFRHADLWRHAATCAWATRFLAQQLRNAEPEEGFLAGLIHDLGFVVLDQYFQEDFRRIARLIEAGTPLAEAEREVLGFDHGAVGAALLERWDFPTVIVDAVATHEAPRGRGEWLPVLVHAAHLLTSESTEEARWSRIWEARPVPPSSPDEVEALDTMASQEEPRPMDALEIDAVTWRRLRDGFEREWDRTRAFHALLSGGRDA